MGLVAEQPLPNILLLGGDVTEEDDTEGDDTEEDDTEKRRQTHSKNRRSLLNEIATYISATTEG